MRLSEYKEEIEDITELLGNVYNAVDWKKIRNRSPYDVFHNRLRVASRQQTITQFLQKLCYGLSLQAPPLKYELIERLDKNQDIVFRLIREGTQYFVYKASEYAKNLKTKHKKKDAKMKASVEVIKCSE